MQQLAGGNKESFSGGPNSGFLKKYGLDEKIHPMDWLNHMTRHLRPYIDMILSFKKVNWMIFGVLYRLHYLLGI